MIVAALGFIVKESGRKYHQRRNISGTHAGREM